MNAKISPEDIKLIENDYAYWAHENYYEFTTKGCNKANGMKVMLDHLSLSRDNCIAIGDSINDLDMLQYAGISVAMGNSPDDIKEICDFVTDTVENSGVGAALEKLIIEPGIISEKSECAADNRCEEEYAKDEIA